MNKQRLVTLFASCIILANCSGSTDPETANVFDNISNLSSGEYDAQVAALDAEAQAVVNANNQSRVRIDNLEGQRVANSAAIASLRGEISALSAELAAAKARLAADPGATARATALEGQLAAVRADVDSGGDASIARAELNRIRSAVRLLSS